MSESEKKQRLEYKLMRKRWMTVQIVALITLLALALGSFLIYRRMNKTYYIHYTENGTVDYRVRLDDNNYYDKDWLDSNHAYVTSLIGAIDAVMQYNVEMDTTDGIDFDYDYAITAKLLIQHKQTGEAIYDPVFEILPKKSVSVYGESGINIAEKISLNFDDYNNIASSFIDSYGLKSLASASLIVTMNVNLLTTGENFDETGSSYAISLNIPLAEQTSSMFTSASAPSGEDKVLECANASGQKIFKTIAIISSLSDVLLLCIFIAFVYLTRNEDINYSIEVKRIVSAYRSFIQQITGGFNSDGYQLVRIKTFREMLAIRDTIQSPVLMNENEDQTRTEFLIPTNTKILYLFEIKVKNYNEIYGIDDDDDYTPTDDLSTYTFTETVEEPIITAEPFATVIEPIVEEPLTEPVIEPVIEPVDDTLVEVQEQAIVTDTVEEPITVVIDEPFIELITEPETITVEEPVIELITEPKEGEDVVIELITEAVPEVIEEAVPEVVEEAVPEVVEEAVPEVVEEAVPEVVEEAVPEVVEEAVPEVKETVAEHTAEEEAIEKILEHIVEIEGGEDDDNSAIAYVDDEGNIIRITCSRSFTANLIQSNEQVKTYYNELKNHILSYKGVKARMSWRLESYNKGRAQLFKMKIRGKTICLYCALDPDQFDRAKYFHERATAKNYAQVPMMVRIKSDRGLKKAKELIDTVMLNFAILKDPRAKTEDHTKDYPYDTTKHLVERKLIKILLNEAFTVESDADKNEKTVTASEPVSEVTETITEEVVPEVVEQITEPEVTESEVTEPEVTEPEVTEPEVTEIIEEPVAEVARETLSEVAEEIVAEEEKSVITEASELISAESTHTAEEEAIEKILEHIVEIEGGEDDDNSAIAYVDDEGNIIRITCSRSFTANLIQSNPQVKAYYNALKNRILSYKGVKARMSWRLESYNKGRTQLFKMKIRGKTICLYCALDPEQFDRAKYFHEKATAKNYAQVPMMVRIKSDRGLKKALGLVDTVMQNFAIPENPKAKTEDHTKDYPYDTTKHLVERKLVKILLPDATAAEPKPHHHVHDKIERK